MFSSFSIGLLLLFQCPFLTASFQLPNRTTTSTFSVSQEDYFFSFPNGLLLLSFSSRLFLASVFYYCRFFLISISISDFLFLSFTSELFIFFSFSTGLLLTESQAKDRWRRFCCQG